MAERPQRAEQTGPVAITRALEMPPSVRLFLWLSLALTCTSLLFVGVMVHLHPLPPHGLPSLSSNLWYSDLLTSLRLMPVVHRPEFFAPEYGWIYPTPCIFIYQFLLNPGIALRHYSTGAILMYDGSIALGLAVLVTACVRRLRALGLSAFAATGLMATVVLCSWPLWFCIHQGNIEVFLFFGMAACVYLVFRERWTAAAIAIGLVSAFKLYPILLLGLLFARRKYLHIALSLAVFAAFNLLTMQYIGPSIAIVWSRLAPGLASFKQLGFWPGYFSRDYLCFDHALIGLIRVLSHDNVRLLTLLSRLWIPLLAIAGGATFLVRVRHQPRLNQLFFLVLAMLLLPPKSYDYTLLALYLPLLPLILLVLRSKSAAKPVAAAGVLLVLMALPLSALFFIRFHGLYYFGQVNCAVLLAMLCLVLMYPLALDHPRHQRTT